jgi:hypothetical protein
MSEVHSVQMMNPKENQQSEGKRKSKGKKGKGDKKVANNVGEGKNEKKKVKFPCKLCVDDHLTHQCPRLEEAHNILAQQQPVVLTNPFPQGKNMAQASSSTNVTGGNQGAPMLNANTGATNVYMMRSDAHLQTRAHDYGMLESAEKGKEASNPSPPLHIEKTMGETMTHIPKGAFKKASHNPNARACPELFCS